jgi:hypothetical protein
MSRTYKILMAGAAALALASCGSAEVASPGEGGFGGGGTGGGGGGTPPPTGGAAADCPTGFDNVGVINNLRNCQLPAKVVGNLVVPLRAGTIYSLGGRTDVGDDQGANPAAPIAGAQDGTLTIEAGVTIFGSSGADFIVVNRGSQIFAEGTATAPIIFTSRQNIEGTSGPDSIGQWGGLVILGRAPIAACPGGVTPPNLACEAQVEGTSAFYGGNTVADNSGRLRYVRVQFPGFEVLPGNELNGITLAGVGNGTVMEYIQVHNSSDDGIEPFGGTVNLRYVVLTGNDDDSFDTDTGYRGSAQFMIIRQRASGGDRMFESSSAGNQALFTRPRISNVTAIGRPNGGDAIILNSGHSMQMYNSVLTGSAACLDIDDAATVANGPTFNSIHFSCPIAFRDDTNVTAAEAAAIFNAGSNNTANGTSTLNGFVNGTNENAVTATPVNSVSAFLQNVDYIGAVRDSNDNWWRGWTCGLESGSTC